MNDNMLLNCHLGQADTEMETRMFLQSLFRRNEYDYFIGRQRVAILTYHEAKLLLNTLYNEDWKVVDRERWSESFGRKHIHKNGDSEETDLFRCESF